MNTNNPNNQLPPPRLLPPPSFDAVPVTPNETVLSAVSQEQDAGVGVQPASGNVSTAVVDESSDTGNEQAASLEETVRSLIVEYLSEGIVERHGSLVDQISTSLNDFERENDSLVLPKVITEEIDKKARIIFDETGERLEDQRALVHGELDDEIAAQTGKKIFGDVDGSDSTPRKHVIKQLVTQRTDQLVDATKQDVADEVSEIVSHNTVSPKDDPELAQEFANARGAALSRLWGEERGSGLYAKLMDLKKLRIHSSIAKTGRVAMGIRGLATGTEPKLDSKIQSILEEIAQYVSKERSRLPLLKAAYLMPWLEDNRNGGFNEDAASQQAKALIQGLHTRLSEKIRDEESLDLFASLEVSKFLREEYPHLFSNSVSKSSEGRATGQNVDPSLVLMSSVDEADRAALAVKLFEYMSAGGNVAALTVLSASVSAIEDPEIRKQVIMQALQTAR